MNKVVVTGATGFIGGALVRKLLSMGILVYGVDVSINRLERLSEWRNFIPVVADFTTYNDLSSKINDDIDVFYHFAWGGALGVLGDGFRNYSIQLDNVRYTCDAMTQAIKIGAKKFVFAGSKNEYEVLRVEREQAPVTRYDLMYGIAKQTSELMCKTIAGNENISYCSGVIANAYGEGSKSPVLINTLIKSLLQGKCPPLATGNQIYDLVYIDDIVNAFIAIGENGKSLKSYYVGHRRPLKFKEVIRAVGCIISPDTELEFGKYPDRMDIDYSGIDLNALYEDTGFVCQADFEASIIKTACGLVDTIDPEKLRLDKMGKDLFIKIKMVLGGGNS